MLLCSHLDVNALKSKLNFTLGLVQGFILYQQNNELAKISSVGDVCDFLIFGLVSASIFREFFKSLNPLYQNMILAIQIVHVYFCIQRRKKINRLL